jgi:hypothetical protein
LIAQRAAATQKNVFLAFWVDWRIWLTGLSLVMTGQCWQLIAQRAAATRKT